MKPYVRLKFADFSPHLPHSLRYFRELLAERFTLLEVDDPDFVIYSNYGRDHRRYRCVRVFYSMENERPDFFECDYAFTFDLLDHPRHFRLPYYAVANDLTRLTNPPPNIGRLVRSKSAFCCFIHSNPFGPERNRLFRKLCRYKRVDSGGRFRNNLGGCVRDKLAFMRHYKFAFAFENSAHPGYTTEKLSEALLAMTVPIYWGNDQVHFDFNPRRFLHWKDFRSDEALIERIIALDRDADLYAEYLRRPCFPDGGPNPDIDPQRVLDRFEKIFGERIIPVAARSSNGHGSSRNLLAPHRIRGQLRRFARHSVKGLRRLTGI
jgi:hypothetical protein